MKAVSKYRALFFLHGAMMNGYFAIWQPKLMERGYQIEDLARLLALQTAAALILDLPTGALADRIGPEKLVRFGAAVAILAFLLPAASASALALAICVLFIGLADSCINGALDAMANQDLKESGAKLQAAYFRREQWAAAGRLVGALAVPGCASLMGEPTRAIWLPLALLSGLWLALTLSRFKHEPGMQHPPMKLPKLIASTATESVKSLGSLASEPMGLVVFGATFFFGLSDGATGIAFRTQGAGTVLGDGRQGLSLKG